MKSLSLTDHMEKNCISLPVSFIDTFMPVCSPEALKVYLYLLRSSLDPSILLSVNDMADLFDVAPNHILRALRYWESCGLLALSETDGELTGIELLPVPHDTVSLEASAPTDAPQTVSAQTTVSDAFLENVSDPAPVQIDSVQTVPSQPAFPVSQEAPAQDEEDEIYFDISTDLDDDFALLVTVTQHYLNAPLTEKQYDSLGLCYKVLNKDYEMTEFLVEYCFEMGHPKLDRYMVKVAKEWNKEGYTDLTALKEAIQTRKKYSKDVRSVMNAFGLKNRDAVRSEMDYIEKWLSDFTPKLVVLACERTMARIHTPSFDYADRILSSWKEKGVSNEADVTALDEQYRKETASEKEPADTAYPVKRQTKRPTKTSFHNFEERTTDFNALVAEFDS